MRGVMLGGQTVLLCFAAAAAVVFSVALLQAGKEFESALAHGQDAGRVELVGRRPPAAGGRQQRAARGARGRWQDLAVWGGQTEKDPEFDTDIAYHKPKWLEQAGSIARGDPVPFSVNRPDAVIPSEAGEDEDGELEETRALRKKLQDAERELEDAHKQLERAEGGANGKSDQVAGQQVGHFADMQVVQVQGPEIKFSKTLLSNGETVRIEWSGVDTVSKMDFIALYTPPDADNHDYLEMHNVTESSTWMMGRGFINVKLFNHRKEGGYEVRYFRKGVFPNDRALFVSTDSNLGQMVMCPRRHCKGDDVYFLVSSSAVASHFPVHEPTQVRLALTGSPTEMRVMWVSEKCPGKPLGGPTVLFGEDSCAEHKARTCRYSHTATPLYRTYGAADLCGPPANRERAQNFMDPGYIYDAVMTGLEPGRRYYYRVGCQDAPDGWHNEFPSHETRGWGYPAGSMMSEEMSFVAPPWTKRDASVSFIAYSDSGVTSNGAGPPQHITWGAPERVNAAISKEVAAGNVGLVLHMGDLAYADGKSYLWEQWGWLTQAVASKVPYMVAVGNHEYTHMPGLVVALTFPASADAVQYNALGASFGKQLTHWREPHVLRGEVVRAGGNYFKGHNLTESLCLDGKLPDAEELVQGRLLYKDRLVLVEAGECGYARKVKVAELYGAAGVILFDQDDKPPKWAETWWNGAYGQMPHYPPIDPNAPAWTDAVSIPSVYLSREDGLDLLQWVDDHSAWTQRVVAELRSSKELQANDPSLGAATTTAAAAQEGDDDEEEEAYVGTGSQRVRAGQSARIKAAEERAKQNVNSEDKGSGADDDEEDEEEGGEGAAATSSLAVDGSGDSGYHPEWGNYRDDSRGECGVPFAQRFHMPSKYGGNGNFWYSFEYGPVRIVAISSEHDLSIGSAQRAWLRRTLHGIDRKVSPWVVVMMHRSIYGRTVAEAEQQVQNHLQTRLEPIFRRFRVNVVFSGHEHRYLRTAPVYMDLNQASTRGQGPTYAMVATGGAKLQFRARDEVHNHFYCVGGQYPMRRCKGCTGENKYVCHDKDACCDYRLDARHKF